MEYPKQRELSVETLRIIDLDRHVFNTELFHAYMREGAWEIAGVDALELDIVKKQKEAAGETLHTDELLLDILTKRYDAAKESGMVPEKTPGKQLMEIFAWVMELCEDPDIRDTLYMPGAKEFIDDIERSGAFKRGEAMFLTYGTTPLQMLKLMCIGFNKHPYIITDERAKGQLIADSRNDEGRYVFTTMNGLQITATYVELYDDKAPSFKGLPTEKEGARGFWILSDEYEALPSQQGEVPANVERHTTFPKLNLALGSVAVRYSHIVDK